MVERPAFRPDLEGLRGLAILLVVLFHAGAPAFAGGFVGVDLFFVLSGYFITGLLARELAETGTVDVGAFYGRRALRLLPLLLVVLVATLALALWLYAPIDRADVAATSRAAALSSGNIRFAQRGADYFRATDNPLLHTWSLAVEEQFYLVWPLVFLGLGAWGLSAVTTASDADRPTRRRLMVVVALIGVASFLVSLRLTMVAQSWAFFGMPTRMWEFVLGALLVSLPARRDLDDRYDVWWAILQLGALVAVALAVARYDSVTPYPGIAALLPALAGAALIVGGHFAPTSAASTALGTPWLRWFGRLSYAWYLWHWPLIGVGQVLDPRIGWVGKLAWCLAALPLAWLSQRLIEAPARAEDGPLARMPRHWLLPAALGASLLVALLAQGALEHARRQVGTSVHRVFAAARGDRMNHDCWAQTVDHAVSGCEFGDRTSSTVFVLLGDSHAEHWLGALDRAGKERGWKIVAMVKGGCPVADMPELLDGPARRLWYECARFREAKLREIGRMRPAAVILSSWDHYLESGGGQSRWQVPVSLWERGLRRTYARLARAEIPMVAIRGTPRTWFDVPACLSRRAAALPFADSCAYPRDGSLLREGRLAQDRAARGLPVRFVDMNDAICDSPRCQPTRGRTVVFTDDNHLTATFSKSVGLVLGERIASALSPDASWASYR